MPTFKSLSFSPSFAAVALLLFVAAAPTNAAQVSVDLVTVGNAGNSADQATGYGAVNYEYKIGKYEVTIGQYTAFLNAKATSDPYGLYNPNMGANLQVAGIARSGSAGAYSYSVINNNGNSANRPITYVSWWDAARFANWVHNGQGSGSTETGAYELNGSTSGTAPAKSPGARFYIPTENEWYKAAFYSPLLNSGSGGYYTFATQSNSSPGNIIGNGVNQANYYTGAGFCTTQSLSELSTENYLTAVGAFTNSSSYYGTFDQSGNASEWNDLEGAAGLTRGFRGGSWGAKGVGFDISSAKRDPFPMSQESVTEGFRIAAVPEPSTWVMGACGLIFAAWGARRRRHVELAACCL